MIYQNGCIMLMILYRDAPIIGRQSVSRPFFAVNRNRLITMPFSADCYLLCIMIALDTEIMKLYFFNLNGQQIFRFIVIHTNLANVLVALFSYALICCIIQ